jgi:hypothetical protein
MKLLRAIACAVLPVLWQAQAQTAPTPALQRIAGNLIVTAVNPQGSQLSVKNDKGETLTVATTDRTQILHAQPGETDPRKWPKMTLAEISPDDEAVVYFRGAADQKPLPASSLVIRTKADLAQLAQKQLDDWKKRGTIGIVTAIDPAAKTIAIKVGQKSVTVEPSDKTEYHRYSLDSAKVSDAKPSTFAEVKTGDELHVLGDKSPDGARIKAESIYAGTFRQLAATIVSINAATGEMKVTDLATKKPLIIRVNSDSNMKKLPDQLAQMLARRYGVAAAARGNRAAGDQGDFGGRRGGGFPGGGAGAGGGQRGGGGGMDVGQMLDRLPALPLADLKPKDAIMVTTTAGSDPSKVTAVMLLAGVEPILTAAPNSTRDIMSGWNLGGGGGEGN